MENKKTNKKTIGLVVGFVAVAIIFFFIGSASANAKNKNSPAQNPTGRFMQNSGNASGPRGMMQRGGGNVFGQIIAKDANSITVELRSFGVNNGGNTNQAGSKIVLYTGSTNVLKSVAGTSADLAVGEQVNVNGTQNPDGSVSAQMITIRPATPVNSTGAPQQ